MRHRYTTTAISLHWLIAIGIAGTFSLGLYMHELPLSPTSCSSIRGTSGRRKASSP